MYFEILDNVSKASMNAMEISKNKMNMSNHN